MAEGSIDEGVLFKCNHTSCSKEFSDRSNWKRHEKRVRHYCKLVCNLCTITIQKEKYQCRVKECERSFKSRQGRITHEKKSQSYTAQKRYEDFTETELNLINHGQSVQLVPSSIVSQVQESISIQRFRSTVQIENRIRADPEEMESDLLLSDIEDYQLIFNQTDEEFSQIIRLLMAKEICGISDSKWPKFISVLGIKGKSSLSYLKKEQEKLNNLFNIIKLGSERGWYFELKSLLNLVSAPKEEIVIKISFDGASINNSMGKEIIGSIQIDPQSKKLNEFKSYKSNYVFLIIDGAEKYEIMRNALREMNFVTLLNEEILINSKVVKISKIFVMDMKMLNIFSGFKSLSHPNCYYRCPYCYVTNESLADFSLSNWSLRTSKEREDMEKIREKTKDPTPEMSGGILVTNSIPGRNRYTTLLSTHDQRHLQVYNPDNRI